LVQALKSLFAAGGSVQEAWVHTLPGFGVYDWFFVSSSVSVEVFERRLSLLDPKKVSFPRLEWSSLQIERPPGLNAWVLHLSGQDQRGLLVWTIEQISNLGGNILSARIQTWGERAEDRLEVEWPKESIDTAEKLKEFEAKIQATLLSERAQRNS